MNREKIHNTQNIVGRNHVKIHKSCEATSVGCRNHHAQRHESETVERTLEMKGNLKTKKYFF